MGNDRKLARSLQKKITMADPESLPLMKEKMEKRLGRGVEVWAEKICWCGCGEKTRVSVEELALHHDSAEK